MIKCANETKSLNGKFYCNAAMHKACIGAETCPFYITPDDLANTLANVNARLNSLDEDKQEKISNKYYESKMPWKVGV